MAVLHEHMAPVAGQGWMSLGFAAQQRVGIDGEAVGLVAELAAAEITPGPLLAGLWRTKSLART
jgi:hypothetical protein